MTDEAVGTAVLVPSEDRRVGETCDRLYFVARYADGRVFIEDIPVAEAKDIAANVGWGTGKGPWTMQCDGEYLAMLPSVNDITRKWHNTYHWRVKYVITDRKTLDEQWAGSPERLVKSLNPQYYPGQHTGG